MAKAWRKAWRLGAGPQPWALGQIADKLRKPPSQGVMGQRMALLRDKEDVRQRRVVQGGPQSGVVAEWYDSGGMERDQ